MSKSTNNQAYERLGKFSLEQVLPFVVTNQQLKGIKKGSPEWKTASEKEYNGRMVKMTSTRYNLFNQRGCTCVKCGLKGTFFALEHHKYDDTSPRYHFNLYGFDKNAKEVMMTQDHIIPRSRGGSNKLDNLQPMCIRCNGEKANKLEKEI